MSEKIIKDQEETKEETKIGSEEIVKNGETKTGSESNISKNALPLTRTMNLHPLSQVLLFLHS